MAAHENNREQFLQAWYFCSGRQELLYSCTLHKLCKSLIMTTCLQAYIPSVCDRNCATALNHQTQEGKPVVEAAL